MKLKVLAAGRMKAGPERTLADDYLARSQALGRGIGFSITLTEFAESKAPTAAGRMADELKSFTGLLTDRSFTVVLDERGKTMGSEAFAALLRHHLDQSTGEMGFLIGGPDGHAPSTRTSAGLVLSFGPMTWPHRLVRVMLLEQIYRAGTIMVKHPYHRS